jgi:hypothetical protein
MANRLYFVYHSFIGLLIRTENLMDSRLEVLLEVSRSSMAPTSNQLEAALRDLPELGTLPSPWESWTLIGLLRHRKRQQ